MKRFVAAVAIVFFIIISNVRLYGLVDNNTASHLFNLKGYEIMSVENDLESSTRLVPQGSILSSTETDTITFLHTVRVNDSNMNPYITVNLQTNEGIKNDETGLINYSTILIDTNDDMHVYQTILTLNRPSNEAEKSLFRSIESFTITFTLKS